MNQQPFPMDSTNNRDVSHFLQQPPPSTSSGYRLDGMNPYRPAFWRQHHDLDPAGRVAVVPAPPSLPPQTPAAEERKKKLREYAKKKFAQETEEQAEERRRKLREYARRRKANETPEQAEERKRKLREYARRKIANETQEEAEERRRKLREYAKKKTRNGRLKAQEQQQQQQERQITDSSSVDYVSSSNSSLDSQKKP